MIEKLFTFHLSTSRLVLREWRDEDFGAFAAMNADPRVTEFCPAPPCEQKSAAFSARIRTEFPAEGFGLDTLRTPRRGRSAGLH